MLLTDSDNWEYITSVESISDKGKLIPPMLIMCSSILILEKWAKKNNLDKDILLAISSIGYSNNELTLQ